MDIAIENQWLAGNSVLYAFLTDSKGLIILEGEDELEMTPKKNCFL